MNWFEETFVNLGGTFEEVAQEEVVPLSSIFSDVTATLSEAAYQDLIN